MKAYRASLALCIALLLAGCDVLDYTPLRGVGAGDTDGVGRQRLDNDELDDDMERIGRSDELPAVPGHE